MRFNEAVVDLSAIAHNVKAVSAHMGGAARIMAVVKADAYGHGAVPVALAALNAGASLLGVANADEALELKRIGIIDAPIVVLAAIDDEAAEACVAAGIELTVYDIESAMSVIAAVDKLDMCANVHIKIDVGMNRLGYRPADVPHILDVLERDDRVNIVSAFTHFPTVGADIGLLERQNRLFHEGVNHIQARGHSPKLHAEASAAALCFPLARHDYIRLGISLYGLHPDGGDSAQFDLRPALSWRSRVTYVHWIEEGESVGYGGDFTAVRRTRIATLPFGYADGFSRRQGNGHGKVIIRGQLAPIIGRVCMDQCMADVTDIPATVLPGEEAVVIGAQGGLYRSANDVAGAEGTISYEILTRIGKRVARRYVEDKRD